MTDNNLTLVLHGKDNLKLEERPILEPGPGQVQVAMKRVGICGSDIHFWTHGGQGKMVITPDRPVALGHEGSGVVTRLGANVTSLKVGDRVAIEPATPCRVCSYCKGGRYNLCPQVKGLATPGYDGHLTRYFVHDADFCHLLPDNVSFDEGAMMEPLAVAVHVTNRAGVKMGDNVVICGSGPIGLLCLLVCRARGASKVIMTDINKDRLQMAKRLGANHTIDVTGKSPQCIAAEVNSYLGDLAHVVLECSGATTSVNTAIECCRPGGAVVLVGVGPSRMEIGTADASMREIDIRGTYRYVNCFPPAIDLVSTGKIDLQPLITHHFDLADSIKAFETGKAAEGIKIMIHCDERVK